MHIHILKQGYERLCRYINTCTLVDARTRGSVGNKHVGLCCSKALFDASHTVVLTGISNAAYHLQILWLRLETNYVSYREKRA